jgi:hypothetical protein
MAATAGLLLVSVVLASGAISVTVRQLALVKSLAESLGSGIKPTHSSQEASQVERPRGSLVGCAHWIAASMASGAGSESDEPPVAPLNCYTPC